MENPDADGFPQAVAASKVNLFRGDRVTSPPVTLLCFLIVEANHLDRADPSCLLTNGRCHLENIEVANCITTIALSAVATFEG